LTKEGETYFGYPAKEAGKARRMEGAFGNYRNCCLRFGKWKIESECSKKNPGVGRTDVKVSDTVKNAFMVVTIWRMDVSSAAND